MFILKFHDHLNNIIYLNVDNIVEILPAPENTTNIITKNNKIYSVNGNVSGKLARLIANVTDGNVIDCPTGE